MSIPIALQLYSVRDDCARDLFGTLREVAAMGYVGVEFAGFHGHAAGEVKKALDDLGLKVAGTHTGINQLDDENFEATVEYHKILGAENIIVPGLPESVRDTPEACAITAEKLTKLVHKLAPLGFKTGFHCHDGDVKPLSGGKSAWYLLAEQTPDTFIMQYDTANGASGGADPVKPLLDFPGRGVTVHLKGWDPVEGWVCVGDGSMPWGKIFEACETVAGTQWYIVEHEDYVKHSAMEGARLCLENLRKLGKL